MTADKIYLVGFMAAGKTTVARTLAARLGWRAEDIDELIEARERRSVADIFARNGEPYLRTLEREILRLLLPLRHAVVATGGGTFMDPDNRAAINMDGVSIWLDVPFEELVARLPADGRRPHGGRPDADGTAVRDATGRVRERPRAHRCARRARGGRRRAHRRVRSRNCEW